MLEGVKQTIFSERNEYVPFKTLISYNLSSSKRNPILIPMKNYFLIFGLGLCLFFGCRQQNFSFSKIDYLNLPTFSESNNLQMVVEIPAGTNHKIEFNKTTGKFENDSINGEVRIIEFLPYPGNYGFIPSTLMDKSRGGDGDALDILVIAESVSTGTVMNVNPIGVLLLKDGGELDSKIIAVPADSSQNVLNIYNFEDLMIEKQTAKRLIEEWFLNYKGFGKMEFVGWRDQKYAMSEIKKWQIISD